MHQSSVTRTPVTVFVLVVLLAGCGGSSQQPTPNPVPSLTSVTPAGAIAGGASFTLTVNGTGFISSSIVEFNGNSRTTTYVSSTQLMAAITAADIGAAGSPKVTVVNPSPGGGVSNAINFLIKALVSIQVTPANPSVTVGAMQQFAAVGMFSDGSTQDLTSSAAWTSSETTTTISSSGQAVGVVIGRPRITATSGSISGSTTLIVVIGQTLAVPRFAYSANIVDNTISVYTVNATSGQLRHNGYALASGNPVSVAVNPSGKFAYTADTAANAVSAFSIDPASGNLTEVPGSPFVAGSGPNSVAVDPSGVFVYTANQGGDVSAFAVNPPSGALVAVVGSPYLAGAQPVAVSVDPFGRFVYVTNASSNTISAYSIDPTTGALTAVPNSPFSTGMGPFSVEVDPLGKFAYVANSLSNNVSAFAINSTAGTLAEIAGSPFAAGTSPNSLTVDPSSKFVYVTNTAGGNLSAYTIGVGGTLTPVPGSPFTTGASPNSVRVDPSGKFAYVANLGTLSESISEFSIDSTTGALTSLGEVRTRGQSASLAMNRASTPVTYTPKFAYVANQNSNSVSIYTISGTNGALASTGMAAAGTQPVSVAVDPSGKFAYVTNLCSSASCSGNVFAYTIDGSTGSLSAVPGSPFAAGNSPRSVAVDPSGRFAYVANSLSSDVSAYTIDSATGALIPVAGSPFMAGTTPFSVTVDPSGRFAYVANSGTANASGNVSAYTIDSRTGTLNPIPGSPFAAGAFPSSVAVDSTGEFAYVVNECGDVVCSLIGSVSAYTIDSSTGTLNPIPGSPFATGMSPRSMVVDPWGKFAYVANGSSSDVSAYIIDSSAGALSPITGSPFQAGAGPRSAAVDPSGKFAYVANQCGDFACTLDGNVSAYIIDSITGALSPMPGSPFAAGAFALSVAITGTIQ